MSWGIAWWTPAQTSHARIPRIPAGRATRSTRPFKPFWGRSRIMLTHDITFIAASPADAGRAFLAFGLVHGARLVGLGGHLEELVAAGEDRMLAVRLRDE